LLNPWCPITKRLSDIPDRDNQPQSVSSDAEGFQPSSNGRLISRVLEYCKKDIIGFMGIGFLNEDVFVKTYSENA
jgi:hypothetical protein